jgi:hypothetical protein
MAGKKGRSGRPQFIPTDEQRNAVKAMCAFGIPHDQICRTIRNPSTGRNISRPTMEKVFRNEIDTAQPELHARIGNFIARAILGQRQPNGEIIKSERVRMRLAMFFAKTRMGWREPIAHEPVGQNKQPINAQSEQPINKGGALDLINNELDRIRQRLLDEEDGEPSKH